MTDNKNKTDSSNGPLAFPEDINWELLKRFMICASSKTFREAKDKIGTSPSALSKQMDELENALGIKLFERINDYRSNQLTSHGELYYNYIKDIYFHLQQLFTTVRKESKKQNIIKIITTPGIAEHLLPNLLIKYNSNFPDVDLQIISEDLPREIKNDEIMIRSGFLAQSNVVKKYIFSHKMHFYASSDYIKKFGAPKKIEDIINHKNLALEGGNSRNTNKGTFFLNRLDMIPDFSSNSLNLLYKLCKDGKGILELPDIFEGVERLDKVLEGELTTVRNVYICYNPNLTAQSHISGFVSLAERFFAK